MTKCHPPTTPRNYMFACYFYYYFSSKYLFLPPPLYSRVEVETEGVFGVGVWGTVPCDIASRAADLNGHIIWSYWGSIWSYWGDSKIYETKRPKSTLSAMGCYWNV